MRDEKNQVMMNEVVPYQKGLVLYKFRYSLGGGPFPEDVPIFLSAAASRSAPSALISESKKISESIMERDLIERRVRDEKPEAIVFIRTIVPQALHLRQVETPRSEQTDAKRRCLG